jgi:hypothetical protein
VIDPSLDSFAASASLRWLEHMRNGAFDAAWQISDVLLQRRSFPAPPSLPRHTQWIWDGTTLHDRRVLVRCYHGLGDTIQFIRYASMVREIASRVIVWCQPSLIPLLKYVSGIDELLPLHDGRVAADYDVDVEVMELPFVFRTTTSSIPAAVPYITVPGLERRWADARRLSDVGIVWKAGEWAPHRSLTFAQLAPLFEIPVNWHIFQAGAGLDEWDPATGSLADAQEPLGTARAMLDLDLLITVDSMPAHLAGALGVPVWTLLPAEADWRWMRTRSDSPWYPTMRLFRQARPGEWADVVRRVEKELRRSSRSSAAVA